MAPSEPKKFFKVILSSTLQEGKMKIPKPFVKEQGGELSETVRLSIPTGQNWNVGIERESDNTVWFIDGVDKFLEDNSIGIGYILVFKYEGSSRFGVQIFDLTAVEVEYNCMDDDSSVECLGSSTDEILRRRWYFTRRRKQVIQGSLPEAREANDVDNVKANQYGKKSTMYKHTTRNDGLGKDRIIDAENKSSQNFFKVTLTHSYIKKQFLRVPADFARLHMPHAKRLFKLVDGENNEWLVRYIRHGCDNNLGSGWGRFVRDKELMVGDVCMFELVLGDEEVKLRVTISRSDGKKSTMHKHTTRNDGLGKERIIDAENKSTQFFFKVTLTHSDIKKHVLRVPTDFARLHMPHSKRRFKLVDCENNGWVVHYIRHGYHNMLGSGWGQFMRDKELMVGDVCMFELVLGDEEAKLRVTISRSDRKKLTMNKDTRRNNGIDAFPSDIGEERPIEPENESSPNFFNATMTRSYIEKGLLGVPSEFAWSHMAHSTMFIKLVDSEDNEWAVRYIHKRHTNFLSLGWKHFVRDKKLMVGDVCLFERVWGDDEVKLRVTISR